MRESKSTVEFRVFKDEWKKQFTNCGVSRVE